MWLAFYGVISAGITVWAVKLLIYLGISITVYTGLSAVSTRVLAGLTTSSSALPVFVLQSLSISQIDQLVGSVLAVYVASAVVRRFTL